MTTYYLPINPVSWAVGPLGIGRRGGKPYPYMGRNEKVHSYQEEIREWFAGLDEQPKMLEGEVTVKCYFWRRLDRWTGQSGRETGDHISDGTNMLKATEDALQGILFENDRQVKNGSFHIQEQGPNTKPGLGIWITQVDIAEVYVPEAVWRDRGNQGLPVPMDNDWPPAGWTP